MPLVTIIIPFKSNIRYLLLALKSVFNQSYKNLKLFIFYENINKKDLKKIKFFLKKKKNILKSLIFRLSKIKKIMELESQEILE